MNISQENDKNGTRSSEPQEKEKSDGDNENQLDVTTGENKASSLRVGHSEIMAALPSDQQSKYNRSKITFVGEGEAGKTATTRSILGLPLLVGSNNHSTVGVDEVTCSLSFAHTNSEGKWEQLKSDNKDFEMSLAQLIHKKKVDVESGVQQSRETKNVAMETDEKTNNVDVNDTKSNDVENSSNGHGKNNETKKKSV